MKLATKLIAVALVAFAGPALTFFIVDQPGLFDPDQGQGFAILMLGPVFGSIEMYLILRLAGTDRKLFWVGLGLVPLGSIGAQLLDEAVEHWWEGIFLVVFAAIWCCFAIPGYLIHYWIEERKRNACD